MELRIRSQFVQNAAFKLLMTTLMLFEVLAQDPAPAGNRRDTVKLLLMLPLTENLSSDSAPWDHGLEILPAAKLAVKHVNDHPSVLQDSLLELMAVDIEPCAKDADIKALVPFVNISLAPRNDVLGIVGGPFCLPLLSGLVSPLASRKESRLFQMFGSTEESVRKEKSMHFITPSIALHYETVYAMMNAFNWSRLYVIAESFFDGLRTLGGSEGLDITFRQFDASSSLIPDLRLSTKNIVFASLGARHAANLLCQAHDGSLLYPDYVWIFHDLTPEAILDSNRMENCDRETLKSTLNGIFFLKFPFSRESDPRDLTLVSGVTYSKLASTVSMDNPYANVVYDSIWAASLALNRSLDGQLLSQYSSRERRSELIDTMDGILPIISFEGASGKINFSEAERVVNNAVDIFLYQDSNLSFIERYSTTVDLSFDDDVTANVPKDTLSRVYILISPLLIGALAMCVIICMFLTTLVLALFIHYRNHSDIKASSPQLSSLMFIGCYLLFTSTLVHTIRGSVAVTGSGVWVVCGAVITGDSIGVNLIFATLLLRMLRVYRIFSHFGKTGKLWTNRNMACIVGVILLGDVVVIVVWSIVDTYRIRDVLVFREDTNPPRYEIQQFCHSDHLRLWLGLLLGKLGVLFVIVLFLAIKTRKIRRSNFKDTKKVNIYIFSTITIVIIFMTLFFLFVSTENALAAHLMVYFAFGFTALLCQLFLFVPKVVTPVLKKYGYEVSYGSSGSDRKRTIHIQIRRQSHTKQTLNGFLHNTQFAGGL